MVIIPIDYHKFLAFILDLEEDIEEIQLSLGVEIHDKKGAVYGMKSEEEYEDEEACIMRNYREFARSLEEFPRASAFSGKTQSVLEDCIKSFQTKSADLKLTKLVNSEYDLFRIAERLLCMNDVRRLFKSIDDFLVTANSILQRRKSRAGRSFENHFEYILKYAEISHEMRSKIDGSSPDVIIPSRAAYYDARYPIDKLFMVALKRTCKERWKQIAKEAQRIPEKHLLTLQQGLSSKQMDEMSKRNVTLIVPENLRKLYPEEYRTSILSVEQFLNKVTEAVG